MSFARSFNTESIVQIGNPLPQNRYRDICPFRHARNKFTLSSPSGMPTLTLLTLMTLLTLLTTKRVFLRAVIAELLWFVSGAMSSLALSEAGIKLWDGNESREYLDSVDLSHSAMGDLGPVYGF